MREMVVKSVLNRKKKRDNWFLDDYTLNPYEGCSFNCQYCYIRGSKYGANMSDTLSIKINAKEVLDRQLAFRVKKDQFGIIALASGTDPYIRAEEQYKMTESLLQVILKHRFPVLIITKSTLVLRDFHLLRQINEQAIHAPDVRNMIRGGVAISFSFSTLDERLSAILEPGAPTPLARLETMRQCKEAGFLVGVNCIPTLPFISDGEEQLEMMVKEAKGHGADYILIGGLTLFGNGPADSKTLYYKFIDRTYPQLRERYQMLYGDYFMPSRRYLKELDARAERLCRKYEIRRTIVQAPG